tara:strand:- start:55 stop:564 length:510 start_codon:yes stop_codon:yes gene_type:complete
MKKNTPLPVDYILARLSVDVLTGVAYWKDATKHHRNLVGRVAGCRKEASSGKYYWIIKINGTVYNRSYIVFAVATGSWPGAQIDHKNGDSLDDRASNIRLATATQNAWNHKKRARKIQLPMGVRHSIYKTFVARITVNKKQIYLGSFKSPDEAANEYKSARATYFGEFA